MCDVCVCVRVTEVRVGGGCRSWETRVRQGGVGGGVGWGVGVARYLKSRCDTYRDTSLMLRLIDYQAKIKEA